MSMRIEHWGTALVLAGAGFAACGGETRVLGQEGPDASAGDTGASTGGTGVGGNEGGPSGGGGTTGSGATCFGVPYPEERAVWPQHPGTADDPATVGEIWLAMKTIDFGEPYKEFDPDGGTTLIPARDIGFDLDGKCSLDLTGTGLFGPSCRPPSFAVAANFSDLSGGRDNAFGKLIGNIAEVIEGFGSVAYNRSIAEGLVSLLFRVRNYNGQPNDNQVELSLFTPAGMDALGSAGRTTPVWDGEDTWPIADNSVGRTDGQPDIGKPLYLNSNAYVSDGFLVGQMAQSELRIKSGITQTLAIELILAFQDSFFVAKLGRKFVTAGGVPREIWTMEQGTIAGRWPVDHFLRQLDQFPDPVLLPQIKPLCYGVPQYQSFRTKVCSFVDIHQWLSPLESSPCDAMSVGIGFTAEQAQPGPFYSLQPTDTQRCEREGKVSPSVDSCFIPYDAGALPGSGGAGGTGGLGGGGGEAGALPDAG